MRGVTIAAVLCLLTAPGFANLITNGSFELGDPSWNGWGFQSLFAPDTHTITGWVVGAGSVDYIGPYWDAADGGRSLDLNGLRAQGTIYQTFSTIIGGPYRVTFALAGNPDRQPRWTKVRVWAADGSGPFAQRDFNFYVEAGNHHRKMGWEDMVWTFTAQSTLTTLGFTSLDFYYDDEWGYSFGPALDNVRVELTPEPATLALVGLGLIAAGFLRRRR